MKTVEAKIQAGDQLCCVNDGGNWLLTEGKEYTCVDTAPTVLQIRNDSGLLQWYMVERFERLPDANDSGEQLPDVNDRIAKVRIDLEFAHCMLMKYGPCGAVESMLRVVAGDVATLLVCLEGC